MLSFNGGKDCTVLLHILFAVLNKSTVTPSSPLVSSDDSDENELTASAPVTFSYPRLLYVRVRSPFPETEVFIQSLLYCYRYPSAAVKRRFLSCDWFGDTSVLSAPLSNTGPNAVETSCITIYDGPIKASLLRLKTDAPDVEAIFMGTRASDPRGASTTVMMLTDPDWPQYMRIHPILDWTYADVWRFIRELSLPYCCLYDRGYTSLGSLEDTHPNPDLRIISPTGLTAYQPAYMLKNVLSERSGRESSTAKSKSN